MILLWCLVSATICLVVVIFGFLKAWLSGPSDSSVKDWIHKHITNKDEH